MDTLPFDAAARIPMPGDNVAIAVRWLDAGTVIACQDRQFTLPHAVMEGHRFVLDPIARDVCLLSFGLPFGKATRDLQPGEYVCNESILEVLAERSVDIELPDAPNFVDHLQRYELDEAAFTAGEQVARNPEPETFMGFARPGGRGVGTRNFVVVLGTTARSAAFARALATRFEEASERFPGIDGVVAIDHTEGSGLSKPNNLDFVLRTLAGFMVHPNVAAVLAVEHGRGAYGNHELETFLREGGYPLDHVPHAFMQVDGELQRELERGGALIEGWLPAAAACERARMPLDHLRVALQCGGSDAFSGVSGNALAGWVAREIIANGGSANLAETDELIGAEPYVLKNVRDLATARRFLDKIETFKQRVANHGASAEGNPSGGNKFRGLYNIALKSIGAARKLDPRVRLDHVIDYGAPMGESGYYFMDSPGNDLESIAGQVASGCNLIFFITGNGSITNFPFVPTLKFVTTSGRFEMLRNEMDVNAGRYNDGLCMDELGRETFQLTRDVASGTRSKGELAGHAQVQIWRDWKQTDPLQVELIRSRPQPDGNPLTVSTAEPSAVRFDALLTDSGYATDQVALVMPTSLCSGQVARLVAEHMNAREHQARPEDGGVSAYVALAHTEGCGSVNSERLFLRTLCGHLRHPNVRRAVLLEHGCEKTHNDAVRHYMGDDAMDGDRLGFASVQLDGGMLAVTAKIQNWFDDHLSSGPAPRVQNVDASHLRLAMLASGPVSDAAADALAAFALGLAAAGATVVIPGSGPLAASSRFRNRLLGERDHWHATIAYAQAPDTPGLHVMDAPTEAPMEIVTGLGGTGVQGMLCHTTGAPLATHPLVPMLQVASDPDTITRFDADLDLTLAQVQDTEAMVRHLEGAVAAMASRRLTPRLFARGLSGFQVTRGLLGVST